MRDALQATYKALEKPKAVEVKLAIAVDEVNEVPWDEQMEDDYRWGHQQ
jgi:hypothetical protein